jgi:hypothetical protein
MHKQIFIQDKQNNKSRKWVGNKNYSLSAPRQQNYMWFKHIIIFIIYFQCLKGTRAVQGGVPGFYECRGFALTLLLKLVVSSVGGVNYGQGGDVIRKLET